MISLTVFGMSRGMCELQTFNFFLYFSLIMFVSERAKPGTPVSSSAPNILNHSSRWLRQEWMSLLHPSLQGGKYTLDHHNGGFLG